VLLMVVAPACGGASHQSSTGAAEPRTTGSKTDTASVPTASAANVSSEAPPQQPELVERHRLEREAPHEIAWVTIRNTYPILQYVFLEDEQLGYVPAGTVGRFEVPPGAHTVTISDSEDGRSNAKSLSEVFDAGLSYYYDVVAR